MKSTDAPSKQAVPFGTNGPREAITATTPSGSNQASYDQGFPPITMTLKSAGGLPPKGQDMNQILFEQSSFNRYFAAGGNYAYDSAFASAIGGYPVSATVANSSGTGFWFNTVEDNQTNPENSTSAITGWIPVASYGVTSLSGLASASVTLTTLQASKDRIILSGTLTANINVVVPAWVKRWEVINNCAGAFNVTIKTPSGSGVSVSPGSTSFIFGDGTNIISNPSPGSLIGLQVFLTTGSYTPTKGTKRIKIILTGGGGGGGGCAGTSTANTISGAGGAGGATAISYIQVSDSSSYPFTIGTGGNGGTGSAGGSSGGQSVFGTIIAGGGSGAGWNGAGFTAGGNGGTATGGNLNVRGGFGFDGQAGTVFIFPGNGGSSYWGSGSRASAGGTSIFSIVLGAGGGGVYDNSGNVRTGAQGCSGVLMIEEYA